MNKKITTALVAAITTFGVYAQAPAPCQGHEKHECAKKHENMTPQQRAEMRTARMTKDLNLTEEQQKAAGFAPYFVDHTTGVYPQFASGTPWTAATMQVKGDPMTDLVEDMAAEQKARTTYDNILRLSDDPDVNDVIKFLRAREVVHFQRFGEAVQKLREKLNEKNVYYMNPTIDR